MATSVIQGRHVGFVEVHDGSPAGDRAFQTGHTMVKEPRDPKLDRALQPRIPGVHQLPHLPGLSL